MLADFVMRSQVAVEAQNWELRTMVKMAINCASGGREEKKCLEAKLVVAEGWAA